MPATVSIVMPNYNHGHYLVEKLDNFLSQTRVPDEILIMDDASTDNSWEILTDYASRYDNIRLFRKEKNEGPVVAVEFLLEQATGDYIHMGAVDDITVPTFFEEMMAPLEVYPEAPVCVSFPAHYINDTGEIRAGTYDWSPEPCFFTPEELANICNGEAFGGCPHIVKRTSLLEFGLIHELKWHWDTFMEMVLAFREGLCYVPKVLVMARIDGKERFSDRRFDWAQEESALSHMLHMLKTSCRDVLPYFQRCQILAVYGPRIVPTVLNNLEHWDIDTFRLIRRILLHVLNNDELTMEFVLNEEFYGNFLAHLQANVVWEPEAVRG